MKILFASNFYPPTNVGGTETYTHGLAKELLRIGHQVQVLCAGEWDSGDKYWNGYSDQVFENVPVRRLDLNWTKASDVNRYLYDSPIVEQFVKEYLVEVRPDLVHVTSCNTLSASMLRAVKQAKLPLVVTLTDFWFICPRVTLLRGDDTNCDGRVTEWDCLECLLSDTKVYRWSKQVLSPSLLVSGLTTMSRHGGLTRWPGLRGMAMDLQDRRAKLSQALSQADRVLIASESARELFQNSGMTIPIDIVPYGHDLSWLSEYKGKQPSGAIRFGFIGQIAPMKGPQLLIEAFRRSFQEGQARLLIYGNLDKDPAFGRHLRSLSAGRMDIEFRGTYPHEASGRVFSEMDVLVVPSLWNDYPLICNEAFATGTPVIASDFGGMKEFVRHQVSGLVFERGNLDDLSRQLQWLATDPGLLKRLQAGVPRVKSIQEAADEMTDIYRNVLKPVRVREPV
jgi:glycosyltransferase involved in cell wall biosynthesis